MSVADSEADALANIYNHRGDPRDTAGGMIRALKNKAAHVGPEDNGRQMSLDRFDRAVGREGYVYELNQGIIEVSDVPEPRHGKQVQEVRNQLVVYHVAHPGAIDFIAGSNEAKILLAADQTERHPDLSVYLSPAPDVEDVWSLWVPEIVIEVASRSSMKRDYEQKPDEYLRFGVDEYWLVDSFRQQMTSYIRWRGQWKQKVVRPAQKYATRHLPFFSLDLRRVFAAAK